MAFFNNILKYCGILLFSCNVLAQVSDESPCGSSANLLAIIDRPTVAVSACTAPEKNIIIETGYQYAQLTGSGIMHNLPEAEIRYGLADHFEVSVLLPNYYNESVFPRVGFGSASIGVKHILASSVNWVFSLDLYAMLPSGSAYWGNENPGGTFSGILNLNLSNELSLSGQFGVSSTSLPVNFGGASFKSFNSDLVLSWGQNKWSVYAEFYGQSKTSPYDGSGYNADFGIIYLVRKNIAIDAEIGTRLSGSLGGFDTYLGSGISIQFG